MVHVKRNVAGCCQIIIAVLIGVNLNVLAKCLLCAHWEKKNAHAPVLFGNNILVFCGIKASLSIITEGLRFFMGSLMRSAWYTLYTNRFSFHQLY